MTTTLNTYADGRPYRRPRSIYGPVAEALIAPRFHPVLNLRKSRLPWTFFWQVIQRELKKTHFQKSTLKVYRHVLRSFKVFIEEQTHCLRSEFRAPSSEFRNPPSSFPAHATPQLAKEFIDHLVDKQVSWSWLSTNISVLRTAFDKIGGLSISLGLRTPKRPCRLPDILNHKQVTKIIEATPTIRDRLLIGLMYGCGLKVGEVCSLRWGDIDVSNRAVLIRYARDTRKRLLSIPDPLYPVLKTGVERCSKGDFIFRGNRAGRHLSERMAEKILKKAIKATDMPCTVTCMTLRHSYAVERIRAGADIRDVQESMGHKNIETTMEYFRFIPPTGIVSPADCSGADQPTSEYPMATIPNLATEDLQIPFPAVSNGAREFYNLLKTHLKGRFLALSGFARRVGKKPG